MTIRSLASAVAVVVIASPLAAQTVAQSDSAAKAAAKANTLPLITTRSLKFATSEATWLSLDLSPDGRILVFEILGDLYTLPAAGGTATRFTSGPAYDMQPHFSPDGKRIVFVSDRNGSENLWIADADGTNARALTTGENVNYVSPVWTPDGQYVVATKDTQLWLWHKDSGTGVQMTGRGAPGSGSPGNSPPSILGPAFGKGANTLWVNVRGGLGGGIGDGDGVPDPETEPGDPARSSARLLGSYQIAQVDRESGRLQIRTHELEGALRPVPSPDGKWLVYATRYDAREALKLLDLATGEEKWLAMDVQRDDYQGGGSRDRDVYPASAFTPDSRALITSFGGKIWRIAVPSGERTELPFRAEVDQQLAPLAKFDYPINDSTLTVTQIRGARPSPDGRRLVFAALDRLWVADLPPAAGGAAATIRNARRLTQAVTVEHAPVWSPDGQYIAYVGWNDSTGGDLYRMKPEGGAPERLTRVSAFYDKLAYSTDGSRLIAIRGSRMHRMRMLEDFGSHSGAAELEYVWLPASGGEVSRISWVGGGATEQGRNVPHIGPDPGRIYVWEGAAGLKSIRYDGTDPRTVVRVTGPMATGFRSAAEPQVPDEVVLSPDGTRALVHVSRNVFLVTVPPMAGEGATIAVTANSAMPAHRLTRVGGDFIGWRADGRVAHYSIGRSFFQADLAQADAAVADSVARARVSAAAATPDTTMKKGPAYDAARFDVEIVARKDKPAGSVVLRGAQVITMKGDEVIPSGDVVVTDNRIVAVGPRGSVPIPAGARVIDVTGKTILPGYVDIHAHTWMSWGLHRRQVSQLMAQLAYGVTTQRDPQTSSEDVLTYQDLMETGELIGPRLYATGPGIFSMDNIKSLDEARDVVRRYADHYHTQTIKQYLAGDRKVRQWVITAAREQGLTATTEGGSNFTMNLSLMQDGYPGLEHSLPISPFYQDVVELEKASGITYTPTLIVSYGGPIGREYYLTHVNLDAEPRLKRFTPHDELDKWKSVTFYRDDQYVFPLHARQLKKLVEAGGRVGLGSHGEVQGLGVHWELWMLGSGGMRPHDVLRIATLHSADAIGLSKDIGSLEVGKMADLQVLDRDPLVKLENSNSIRYVMKNGRLYDAATLDEVWPRKRALPTQWWWRVEPAPTAPADQPRQ